jgi:apolipoprotein D and lipocalin family protein
MNRQQTLVFAGAGATVAAAAGLVLGLRKPRVTEYGVMRTAEYVDLERYAGRWFEIAHIPSRYERHCLKNATVDYAVRPDGKIHVEARCTQQDGTVDSTRGVAQIVDTATNAKWRIKYARAGRWMDYWVLEVGPDYRWAVVGEPKREFLWVLSRTPGMDEALYDELRRNAVTQGYDSDKLVRTAQDGA